MSSAYNYHPDHVAELANQVIYKGSVPNSETMLYSIHYGGDFFFSWQKKRGRSVHMPSISPSIDYRHVGGCSDSLVAYA
jgi:hypothetical protein